MIRPLANCKVNSYKFYSHSQKTPGNGGFSVHS